MAAESASAMWDCICAHAITVENEKRKETASADLTRVENIASSCARLPPGLRGAIIQLIPAGSKSPTRHTPANPPTRSPLLWRAKVGAARRAGSQGYPPPPKRSGGG